VTDDERKIVEAMGTYGGSFVRALATAMMFADPVNFATLRDAFPADWRRYERLATKEAGKQ